MNLTINNVNFNGKNEVIYGLKKAAEEARNIKKECAYLYGPRPINKTENIHKAQGALDAYTNMVVHDKSFIESINEISKDKRIINSLKETLTTIRTTYGDLFPNERFIEAIQKSVKKAEINASSSVENFLNHFKM